LFIQNCRIQALLDRFDDLIGHDPALVPQGQLIPTACSSHLQPGVLLPRQTGLFFFR
jgi:hypothetical protein